MVETTENENLATMMLNEMNYISKEIKKMNDYVTDEDYNILVVKTMLEQTLVLVNDVMFLREQLEDNKNALR